MIKSAGKRLLRRLGFDLKRTSPNERGSRIRRYVEGGSIPWSAGYNEAKHQFISEVLSSAVLMEAFRSQAPLPPGYGVALDERCVEYPWLLSHLRAANAPLLDAGSTLNYPFVMEHAPLEKKQLHILTLAPEQNCFWNLGVSYLFADLRAIPVRDDFYGNIACLSTLEHVGWDNSAISGSDAHRESRPDDFIVAMRELRRVLKPGGALYVTVPYGRQRHYGTFQQFDAPMMSRAIAEFGLANEMALVYYRYTADGWNLASENDCADCEFTDWILRKWRGELRASDVVVDADRSAAARAVACLRIVKC